MNKSFLAKFSFASLIVVFLFNCAFLVKANDQQSKIDRLIPIKRLLNSPKISQVKLNPQGNYIAMAGYTSGRFNFSLVDMEQATFTEVINAKKGENIFLKTVQWIDDKHVLLETYNKNNYLKKHNKWLVSITNQQPLQHKLTRINSPGYVIDTLPNEPNKLLYSVYKGKGSAKQRIYKTDIDALIRNNFKNQEKFDEKLSQGYRYKTDHQHQIRFAATYDEDQSTVSHWYLDKKNDWQKYFEHDPSEVEFSPVGFLPNGKLAVITNADVEFVSLFEFDVEQVALGKVLYQHPRYDITGVEYNKNSAVLKSVSFIENGEWQTEYFAFKNEQINQLLQQTFEQQYRVVSSTPDDKVQIIKTFSASDSGKYYYFEQAKKRAKFIGNRDDFIDNYPLAEIESLSVSGKEGHVIEALLTKPPPQFDNNTLLVMPHGGPIGVRNVKNFNAESQYFSSRGYSVLQVNFRGSKGFGKGYKDSGRGQFGKVIEEDISTVVESVLQNRHFSNICAIGASYGGYSSVMLAIKHPDLYQCVIARFGVFDLPLIFNDRNTMMTGDVIEEIEKVVGENNKQLNQVSPVYFADKLKAPILITAGVKDTRASFEHSNRMKLVLEANKADVEHLYYPHSAHGHSKYLEVWHELAYIDDFIRRKLNLPLPKGNNAKHIKQNELELIADGFINDNIIGKLPEQAKLFNARAQALKKSNKTANLTEK
ncbi:MAG: alpha/beta hydrolase family protein [Thalassotalea sp.]